MSLMLSILITAFAAFAISLAVVPVSARYARKRRLLDIPNERSSHKTPTPRTGGIGIVAGVVVGVMVGLCSSSDEADMPQLLFMAALLAGSATGFMDDVFKLPTAVRMLLYLACASWLALGGANIGAFELPGFSEIVIGAASMIFSALFIAWYANLFNFMDGIDGIAGGASTVTMAALAFLFFKTGDAFYGSVALSAAAASIAFLVYNRPPAKVFMGDGGSVFIGLGAGALSLVAVKQGLLSLPACVLLMLPFVFDATFTLTRRIIGRERFWQAHRSHVYQQMCDLGLSHGAVTAIYTASAVFFAFLGLAFEFMPAWAQNLAWWGSLVLALCASVFVVSKNRHLAT